MTIRYWTEFKIDFDAILKQLKLLDRQDNNIWTHECQALSYEGNNRLQLLSPCVDLCCIAGFNITVVTIKVIH